MYARNYSKTCQGSQLSSRNEKKWRSHTCDGIKPGFSVLGLISSGYFNESPWDIHVAQTLTNIFNSMADKRRRDILKCVCNKWIETPGWITRVRAQDRSVSCWRKGTRRIRSKSKYLIKYQLPASLLTNCSVHQTVVSNSLTVTATQTLPSVFQHHI